MKPETVIGWHRRGFARLRAWKSKRVGRPRIKAEIVELIVRMAKESPTWSRRRIAMELAKLGVDVDKNTVARFMPKPGVRPRPASQTWRTFIRNHLAGTLAIDFFTVPTVTFYILHAAFDRSVENLGVRQLRIAPRSPWQNGYAERLVGTLRRDLTDHLIVLGERNLLRRVREYASILQC